MIVRRVVYRAIFPLAIVLPIWVLIGRGIIADGIGWQFVVYLFVAPLLFIALCVIGLLIVLRPDAREAKAVSWWDAALLIALWLTLIASGFYAVPAIAVVAVLLLIGGFWLALFELIGESRRRFEVFAESVQTASQRPTMSGPQPAPIDIGEVIVVTSQRIEDEPLEPKKPRPDADR